MSDLNFAVIAQDLSRDFTRTEREPGSWGMVKGFFKPVHVTKKAVQHVTLKIQAGHCVGLVGANGAGKTTLLKMLAGLLHPTSGELTVLGTRPADRVKSFQKSIGMVMGQKSQLWLDIPAQETFELLAAIYEVPRTVFDRRVSDLSKLFQVDKLLRTQVRRLSLGERMKLEIIAAVLHNPKFLILDEPTIGLDVVSRRTIRDFVADLNKNHGTTVVLSSHDMIDISELCQDLVLIDQGQILFNGRLADFSKHHLAKSQDRVLALSFASANIVQADFESELALTQAQLLDWTGAGARIRVKADLTGTALAKLVGRFDFSDIRIEGPGLEEIVHGLLSKS